MAFPNVCRIRWLLLAAVFVGALPSRLSAEKLLIIGDSLSKEYAVEFPILFPTNPAAWGERNWAEILNVYRKEAFDLGPYQAIWLDSRITGHEYNWAFPGSKTDEWVENLTEFSLDSIFLRSRMNAYLDGEVDRVVVFLGGNDLNGAYRTYYEGADPDSFINEQVNNVTTIVDYVRNRNRDLEIVVVNMVDVGLTQDVRMEHPDPVKRKRMTDVTAAINAGLKALADNLEIGYADVFEVSILLQEEQPYCLAGVDIRKETDPEAFSNRPEYLFSPDGFHPNTNAHLVFANRILAAFNETYPDSTRAAPLTSAEMLEILGLDPLQPYRDFRMREGLPGNDDEGLADADADGWTDRAEFLLGLDPLAVDAGLATVLGVKRDRLEVTFPVGSSRCEGFQMVLEKSTDLRT
ncbi:MAG: SGNH/GDSL hydrolase family protein, partial [Verrucomicrobiota bacterium]